MESMSVRVRVRVRVNVFTSARVPIGVDSFSCRNLDKYHLQLLPLPPPKPSGITRPAKHDQRVILLFDPLSKLATQPGDLYDLYPLFLTYL